MYDTNQKDSGSEALVGLGLRRKYVDREHLELRPKKLQAGHLSLVSLDMTRLRKSVR